MSLCSCKFIQLIYIHESSDRVRLMIFVRMSNFHWQIGNIHDANVCCWGSNIVRYDLGVSVRIRNWKFIVLNEGCNGCFQDRVGNVDESNSGFKICGWHEKLDFVGVDVFSILWFNCGNWSKSSMEIGLFCISDKVTRGTKWHGFQNEPMKDTEMLDHIIVTSSRDLDPRSLTTVFSICMYILICRSINNRIYWFNRPTYYAACSMHCPKS